MLLFLFFSGGLLKRNSKAVTEGAGVVVSGPVNQCGYIRVKGRGEQREEKILFLIYEGNNTIPYLRG